MAPEADVLKRKPSYRQTLGNMADMQYFGDIEVGGQPLKAILDTGSFELVVFSTSCPNCGIAAEYNEEASSTFLWGTESQTHSYGSGSCDAKDGFDNVAIGTVTSEKLPLWLALKCDMPLLARASFNAIAGIGPPGQPEYMAKAKMKQLDEIEGRFKQRGEAVPRELEVQRAAIEKALEAAKGKKSMLESFGVTTFSTCLGRAPQSAGYLIWNDKTRAGVEGVQRIPVAGNITWGVSLKDWGFHHNRQDESIGCTEGCGSIVDTGTSLLAVPTPMYEAMVQYIKNLGVSLDCSDLSKFPDLVMTLGGQHLKFPPSAYLGSFVGQMNSEVEGFVRTEGLGSGTTRCQMLLMDLGPVQQTTLGPMIILGMPFFREYYTTFDLGRGRGDRSIFVSPASDSCEPELDGLVSDQRTYHSLRNTPRTVDLSTVRVPQWFKPSKHFQV